MPIAIFRADANPDLGSGHVVRCMALVEMLAQGGWEIGFAGSEKTFESVAALAASQFEKFALPEAASAEADAIKQRWPRDVELLIVDHYERDAELETALRGWTKNIVVLDDLANRKHDADLLADSSASSPKKYTRFIDPDCEVLAGPRYAILRPAFRLARTASMERPISPQVNNVFISFGQMDPPNATGIAIDALRKTGYAGNIDVVLGGSAPHLQEIRTRKNIRCHTDIGAEEIAALMANADLAIGAGGGTAWERCCLGLPTIVVAIADNQNEVIARLHEAEAAVYAGAVTDGLEARIADAFSALAGNSAARKNMQAAAAALVDGRGANRIIAAALGRSGATAIRPAEPADENWLLALQHKPETRAFAGDRSLPTAAAHKLWMKETLANPNRMLFIVEHSGEPAGMLRLDVGEKADRVSIAVDPAFHRRGIGSAALAFAVRLRPGRTLDAEVFPENKASLALFAAAGYLQAGNRLFKRVPS